MTDEVKEQLGDPFETVMQMSNKIAIALDAAGIQPSQLCASGLIALAAGNSIRARKPPMRLDRFLLVCSTLFKHLQENPNLTLLPNAGTRERAAFDRIIFGGKVEGDA